ncbi:MAG: helix-turn-helix transcriptional regulator [bacterium]|nr:helix-turn-helix transcriptional regulator [bacterium]
MAEETEEPVSVEPATVPTCFVISPISLPPHLSERYGNEDDHFRHVIDNILLPSVEAAGLVPKSPIRDGSENIQAAVIKDLEDADLVLADLSTLNANVFFELGIRTALDRPVCLVWDGYDRLPFDSGTINTHQYEPPPSYNLSITIAAIALHIRSTLSNTESRNEVWKYFGSSQPLETSTGLNAQDAELAAKIDQLTALLATSADELKLRLRSSFGTYRAVLMRKRRNELGMGMEDLARLSGLTRTQISRFETGRSTPRPVDAGAIADALHISVDDLLFGADGDDPSPQQ